MTIPAYTIKELNECEVCPLGDWVIVSEDRQDILGRMFNAKMITIEVIEPDQGQTLIAA